VCVRVCVCVYVRAVVRMCIHLCAHNQAHRRPFACRDNKLEYCRYFFAYKCVVHVILNGPPTPLWRSNRQQYELSTKFSHLNQKYKPAVPAAQKGACALASPPVAGTGSLGAAASPHLCLGSLTREAGGGERPVAAAAPALQRAHLPAHAAAVQAAAQPSSRGMRRRRPLRVWPSHATAAAAQACKDVHRRVAGPCSSTGMHRRAARPCSSCSSTRMQGHLLSMDGFCMVYNSPCQLKTLATILILPCRTCSKIGKHSQMTRVLCRL